MLRGDCEGIVRLALNVCDNLYLSVEQVMTTFSISRATVFREYNRIKELTGANYNKKTGTWKLG